MKCSYSTSCCSEHLCLHLRENTLFGYAHHVCTNKLQSYRQAKLGKISTRQNPSAIECYSATLAATISYIICSGFALTIATELIN